MRFLVCYGRVQSRRIDVGAGLLEAKPEVASHRACLVSRVLCPVPRLPDVARSCSAQHTVNQAKLITVVMLMAGGMEGNTKMTAVNWARRWDGLDWRCDWTCVSNPVQQMKCTKSQSQREVQGPVRPARKGRVQTGPVNRVR